MKRILTTVIGSLYLILVLNSAVATHDVGGKESSQQDPSPQAAPSDAPLKPSPPDHPKPVEPKPVEPKPVEPKPVEPSSTPSAIDRWDRVVYLVAEKKAENGTKSNELGSAFIILVDDELVLVTAQHMAKMLDQQSRLFFPSADRETSIWLRLIGLVHRNGNPWQHHPRADVSMMVLNLKPLSERRQESLHRLAVPLSCITDAIPGRTKPIEIVGFPMTLGTSHPISPFVMTCRIASIQRKHDANWGKEDVFYAFPDVGHGTSGGPAFRTDQDSKTSQVVGMYVGYQSDKGGARLSRLVPPNIIKDWAKLVVKEHLKANLISVD